MFQTYLTSGRDIKEWDLYFRVPMHGGLKGIRNRTITVKFIGGPLDGRVQNAVIPKGGKSKPYLDRGIWNHHEDQWKWFPCYYTSPVIRLTPGQSIIYTHDPSYIPADLQ